MKRLSVWKLACVVLGLLATECIGLTFTGPPPPSITVQPVSQSLSSGVNTAFSVEAAGAIPLTYQWQLNATNLVQGTNALLTLTNIHIFQAGEYRVIVTNAFGSVTSTLARLAIDNDLVFRITGLVTNGAIALEHAGVTGDDSGGIAVSSTHVFCTGDNDTARWGIEYLTGAAGLGTRHQGLVTDLRTQKIYTLGNGTTPITGSGTVSSLLELNGTTGTLIGNRIDFSSSIPLNTGNIGIYSGFGRLVLHNASRAWSVALPSGVVTDLGQVTSFNHSFTESWANWGIAEYIAGAIYVVYVQNSQAIVRTRIPGNTTTTLASFSNLSDMASIGFSVPNSRWYFHHEGTSQFRSGGDEIIGSAKAFYTVNPDEPFIVRDPQGSAPVPGVDITFTVSVSGADPFTYQWRREGTNIVGATNATLLLANITAGSKGNYSVEVRNAFGSAVSNPAFLDVVSTPEVINGPFDQSVLAGTNVFFNLNWRAAPPATFQWFFNNGIIAGATNANLMLTNVTAGRSGFYSLQISNIYGKVTSRSAELFVFVPQADGAIFQVAFLTNDSRVIDTWGLMTNRFNRSAIAASASHVFVTGPFITLRARLDDLGGATNVGVVYEAMASNLRTEQAYALANDTNVLGFEGGTITRLLEIEGTNGVLNGRSLRLSQPVPAARTNFIPVGIFSGYGRIVIHNGIRAYLIYVPSGQVVDMGPMARLGHLSTQGWAHWGIVEHVGGITYLVYGRDSQTIVRTRVPDAYTTTVNSFQNISFYMSSITASISRNRWYFQHLFNSQFSPSGNFNQVLGYATAQFVIATGSAAERFEFAPFSKLQQFNRPFEVTVFARNVAGGSVSNFQGVVNLRGTQLSGTNVNISPTAISNFVNGAWTGMVTVSQFSTGMVLRAEDSTGAAGISGEFLVVPPNDLALLMRDEPDPVIVGLPFSYVMLITNTGPNVATSVMLTNPVPANTTFQSVTTSVGSCLNQAGIIRCNFGNMAVTGAVVTLTLIPNTAGTVTNRAGVVRGESDPVPVDNFAVELTTVTFPQLTIDDVVVLEGNSGTNDMVFNVSLSQPSTNMVRVSYATANGTAISAGALRDYLTASATLIFPVGATNQTITIRLPADTLFELDETFTIQLFNPISGFLADSLATGTILNDDPVPTLAISDVSVIEGNSGTTNAIFSVTLSSPIGMSLPVGFATSNATALAGIDYQSTTGIVTFAAGSPVLTQFVSVPVLGDASPEANEQFYVDLSTVTNVIVSPSRGTGTILNDEGVGTLDHFAWSVIPAQVSVQLPFAATLTALDFFNGVVSNYAGPAILSASAGQPQAVGRILGNRNHDLVQAEGSFTIGYAFTPAQDLRVTHFRHYSGTKVSIWTDSASLVVSANVTSIPGTWLETPLVSPVILTAGNVYVLGYFGGGQPYYWATNTTATFAHGTIGNARVAQLDDYPTDAGGGPEDPFAFLVDIVYTAGPPARPLQLTPTISGTFTNGIWSGPLTISEEATNVFLRAQSSSQRSGESNPFEVAVAGGADLAITSTLPTNSSVGAIITNVVAVRNFGPAQAEQVRLTNFLSGVGTILSAVSDQGTCTNTSNSVACALGTVTNGTVANVRIAVRLNVAGGVTNTFQVGHSVADLQPTNNSLRVETLVIQPGLSLADVSVVEGNSGSSNLTIRVSLSPPSDAIVRVNYTTANGTALGTGATRDFIPASGTLTFPPGTTNQDVTIVVQGDVLFELDETFALQLFTAFFARIDDAEAQITIFNDDAPASVSVHDVMLTEGHGGITNASFQVVLSARSGVTVTVDFATSNNTAIAGQDYVAQTGRMQFVGGSTVRTQLLNIAVLGDLIGEADETFFLQLIAVENATTENPRATATIRNDDVAGAVNHFVWDPVPFYQYISQPFPVALAARDAFGNVVSDFAGPVSLEAVSFAGAATKNFLGPAQHSVAIGSGPRTDGYSFTPQTNLLVTHVRHYSGDKVSLWTEQGALLTTQPVISSPGTWTETPLDMPIALSSGTRYRLGVHTGAGENFARIDILSSLSNVTFNQSFSSAGDQFPNQTNAFRWPLVDLAFAVGTPRLLALSIPSAGPFVNGVWNGVLAIQEPARFVVLRATDTNGHRGITPAFEVNSANDLRLSASAQPKPVVLGQAVTYHLRVENTGPGDATGVVLTNLLPPNAGFVSGQTTLGTLSRSGNLITVDFGTVPGGSDALVTLIINPLVAGTMTNYASLKRNEPDADPSNDTVVILVDAVSAIVNGSFETGNFNGWIVRDLSSTYLPLQVRGQGFNPGFNLFSVAPTDGQLAATHGFVGGAGPEMLRIAQDVFVPPGSPVLSFDWRVGWQLFGGTQPHSMEVRIEPRGGGTPLIVSNLVTVAPFSVNLDNGPRRGLIDLGAYAGGSVRISFDATVSEPFIGPGLFQLDNVLFVRGVESAPTIVTQPASASVLAGTNVTFTVGVTGTRPLSYRWLRNGTNIAGATNENFSLANVSILDAGIYRVVVTNQFGNATSADAVLEVDAALIFQIVSLQTNGAITVDTDSITGDDRGPLAVSGSRVFYTGDGPSGRPVTVRLNLDGLGGAASTGVGYDALVSDLRTEIVYSLGRGADLLQATNNTLNFPTLNSLHEIDGVTGLLNGKRINLSTDIPLPRNSGIGIFAGYGRIVIHNGQNLYSIALPSGAVSDLGPMLDFFHAFNETWAYWGIAEYFNGTVHLVYIEHSAAIVRRPALGGVATPLLLLDQFPAFGDMASIAFSLSRSRWIFHHESGSIFSGGGEVVGSAKASYTLAAGFPFVVQPPQAQIGFPEETVTFSVVANGTQPLHYQWFFKNVPIKNATNVSLVLLNISTNDAGAYHVEVNNTAGFVSSVPAVLTVIAVPEIFLQPVSVSVFPGTNLTLEVGAIGAPPLFYQWRKEGIPIAGETNNILVLTNVQPAADGIYTVAVSNRWGTRISDPADITVIVVVDDGSVFRITSLQTNGSVVIDHNTLTGDDRGAIAASSSHVFYSGDERTARFALGDLSGGTRIGTAPYDGLVSDLRTEILYGLGNGTNLINSTGGTVTSLIEFTPLGELSGRSVTLSRPIPVNLFFDQVGLFAGYGRVVIHNNANVYSIALPSGRVTDLGAMNPLQHVQTESWAYWGVAEHFGGLTYLLRVRDFGSGIARTRVPDGESSLVGEFFNLSDMAVFTVSVPRQRWYFHYEGSGQFGGTGETLGFANATFEINSGAVADHFGWGPISRLQLRGVPFQVTVSALTTSNLLATNFNGVVNLRGVHAVSGAAVSISPTVISNFVNGTWTGQITVNETSTGVRLVAETTDGLTGTSGEFFVPSTNDLIVVASDSVDPVNIGQPLSYTILVTNTGPSLATGVTLTNTFPLQAGFISVTTTHGSCLRNGNVVRCDLGSVAVSNVVRVEINLGAPASAGTFTNIASVVRNEVDPAYNNIAVETTTVAAPLISVTDVTLVEGDTGTNTATFELTLSRPFTNNIRVSFATADGSATVSGTFRDYLPRAGTVIFPPNSTTQTVSVPVIGDRLFEGAESFLLRLFAPIGAVIADNEGVATIINDDLPPVLTVSDVSVVEGENGTTNAIFSVRLSEQTGVPALINYMTADGSAQAGSDYSFTSGQVSFLAGSTELTQTVTVPIFGDRIVETNESFRLQLLVLSNATPTQLEAVATIATDDGAGFVHHFEFSTIASPQEQGRPIPVTIVARDFFETVITNFQGAVTLQGAIGLGTPSTIVITEIDPGNPDAVEFANVSPSAIPIGGWRIVVYDSSTFPAPTATVTIPNGTTVLPGSLFRLDESGTPPGTFPNFATSQAIVWVNSPANNETAVLLLDSAGDIVDFVAAVDALPAQILQPRTIPLSQWSSQPVSVSTNILLTYQRVGNFDHNDRTDWSFQSASVGTLNLNMSAAFTGGLSPVSISPSNAVLFTNGVWSGFVTVQEPGSNIFIRATDVVGHTGESARFDVPSLPRADLAVIMSALPNPVPLGSNVVVTILVTNMGPATASLVSLSNSLPPGWTVLDAVASQGSATVTNGVLEAFLGTLTKSQTATVTVTAQVSVLGTMTNAATVRGQVNEPTLVNNRAQLVIPVWRDSDGDGMPDEWEMANGLDINNAADAFLDADSDGQTNLQEFRAGTDPRDENSILRITSIGISGNDVRLQFRGIPGKLYRLERTDNNAPGVWTTVLVFGTGQARDVEIVDTGGANRSMAMYRISLLR